MITTQTISQLVMVCNLIDLYYLARSERDHQNYSSANYYLDLADQCLATGNVSGQINSHLQAAFQMERCASGYYSHRIKEGREACQALIGNPYYGELAFKNLPWYFQKIERTPPT